MYVVLSVVVLFIYYFTIFVKVRAMVFSATFNQ